MTPTPNFNFDPGKEKEPKKNKNMWLYLGLGIVIVLVLSLAAYNELGVTSSVTADLKNDEDAAASGVATAEQNSLANVLTDAQNTESVRTLPILTGNIAADIPMAITPEQKNERSSDVIKLVIELYDNHLQKDTVKLSETVTRVDSAVKTLGSSSIQEAWETLALCLAHNCSESNFLDFINTIAIEGSKTGMENARLIANLITADKYWGTDNVVRLSEAITAVDKEVKARKQPLLENKWQSIVTCDGTCSEKTTLIFNLLRALP